MDLFDKIRERPTGQLSRLDLTDIGALKNRHPGLPADYLRFLTEVGYGDLGELQIHSGPSAAKNFYPTISKSLESVLVFGDDKQGYCFGFDTNDGFRVVEVSPGGEVAKDVEPVFSSLIQGYFG
jgi:hypothetical protein